MQSKIITELTPDELAEMVAERLYCKMKNDASIPQKQTSNKEELLTPRQVAEHFSITLPTVNSWVKREKLIAHRIGRKIRFKRSELNLALTTIRVK